MVLRRLPIYTSLRPNLLIFIRWFPFPIPVQHPFSLFLSNLLLTFFLQPSLTRLTLYHRWSDHDGLTASTSWPRVGPTASHYTPSGSSPWPFYRQQTTNKQTLYTVLPFDPVKCTLRSVGCTLYSMWFAKSEYRMRTVPWQIVIDCGVRSYTYVIQHFEFPPPPINNRFVLVQHGGLVFLLMYAAIFN